MTRKTALAGLAMLLGLLGPPASAATGGHASVNGIRMYHEVHGAGDGVPLVMIHGGGSTIDSAFATLLPLLARNRRVVALEEQGHGRTEGRAGPVSFVQTADDVAALMTSLGIERADVFGFSNGASSGMQLAIRHPGKVRKLVFVSAFTKRSGAAPGFWGQFKATRKCELPPGLREAFLKVNPSEKLADEMCAKDAARMKTFADIPDTSVRTVRSPTLIMMGDRDVVSVRHGAELVTLLRDARLAVLPGGHGTFFGDGGSAPDPREPALTQVTADIVDAFLALPPATK